MNFRTTRPSQAARRGLTILDGIVVLSILAILAAFFIRRSMISGYPQKPLTDCSSNLHQIGLACELYLSDFGRHKFYPPGGDVDLLNALFTKGMKPVLKDQYGLLVCMKKGTHPPSAAPITTWQTDYLFKAGGSYTESALLASFTADEPIGIDKPGNHKGEDGWEESANVLFFDTHVEYVVDPVKIEDYRRRIRTPGPTR